MICDVCKTNEASIYMTKVVNGMKTDFNICTRCAEAASEFSFMNGDEIDGKGTLALRDILDGILEITDEKDFVKKSSIRCPSCDWDLNGIDSKSKFGCPHCYTVFSEKIKSMRQGSVFLSHSYTGKVPDRILAKKKMDEEIIRLKINLEKAIEVEDYEEAAILRDKLKEIYGGED